jgi:hypothetical protein
MLLLFILSPRYLVEFRIEPQGKDRTGKRRPDAGTDPVTAKG